MSHKMAEMRRLSKQLSLQNFEDVVLDDREKEIVKADQEPVKEEKNMLKDFKLSKSGSISGLKRRTSSSNPISTKDQPEALSQSSSSILSLKQKRPSRSRSSILPQEGEKEVSAAPRSLDKESMLQVQSPARNRRASMTMGTHSTSLSNVNRLSDSAIKLESLTSASNNDEEFSQHLKELKQQPSSSSRGRSDSLARMKDSALEVSDDPLTRITASYKASLQVEGKSKERGRKSSLERTSGASGGGSHGGSSSSTPPGPQTPESSNGSSPTVSPSVSPRHKNRSVIKAVASLELGDMDYWKKSLLDSRLVIVGALFDAAEEEELTELAENLVTVFEKNHRSIRLMIWAVRKEVNQTIHENDMFRLDSVASKLMSAYGCLIATDFVKDLLKPMIKKVQTLASKSDDIPENKIWKLIDGLLEMLSRGKISVPFPMRVLCFYIKEEMEKRFPGKGNIGIGGFIFLRLICPSIVAPGERGVIKKEVSVPERKVLVRVARELQRLVNFANRGQTLSTEMYGETTEQITFVGLNLQRIKTFLDGVGTKTLEELNESKSSESKFPSPLKKLNSFSGIELSKSLGDNDESVALDVITAFVKRNRKKLA